jgi:site-specific DNA-methyltransferase (adenine-specific)
VTEQATFSLAARNPDVLTCIANLSNDEVFTPPDFANRILDTLAEVWALNNAGTNLWAQSSVTFLDPFTKSAVFLREITKRLVDGLASEIPDLQERVDHILTRQVYGIAITELTALLARRTLYCSKWADGPHSIAKSFSTEDGNVWFERTEHTWVGGTEWVLTADKDGSQIKKYKNGKCKYCGANQRDYERGDTLETHAYAFIHTDDIKGRIGELFGEAMKFDVIIGNPPYQLGQSGGEAVGNFAMPVYQRFVQTAKALEPSYAVMITPSRWFAGGRGLDDFRNEMLTDRRLRILVDYPESREVFAGVDIAGGVSYFLWDSSWDGACEVTTITNGVAGPKMARFLDEYDILVRHNEAVSVLHRVLGTAEGSTFDSLASRVAPIQPFSLRTNFRGAPTSDGMSDPVAVLHSEGVGYIERGEVPRNVDWVDEWKVIVGGAVPAGGRPDKDGRYYGLIGIRVLPPGMACTETYLVANRFSSQAEADNFAGYLQTKFVRFLIWLRTNTHHLYSERFAFVPELPMDRPWTDSDLYTKYSLTDTEVEFIESMIRPMEIADA